MRLPFNEAKATQTACRLLAMRGGRMSYMKLIKLLYLIDRTALLRWGRPVTTDTYVSMDKGPVVSRIYELIVEEVAPGVESVWRRYISERQNYEVQILADPGSDELSEAEERLIAEVFAEHGHKGRWELVDYAHTLPEWEDPKGSSIRIEYRDILIRNGKTDLETHAIENELDGIVGMQRLLA